MYIVFILFKVEYFVFDIVYRTRTYNNFTMINEPVAQVEVIKVGVTRDVLLLTLDKTVFVPLN